MKINNRTSTQLSQLENSESLQNRAGRLAGKKNGDVNLERADSVKVALSDRAQDIKKVKDLVDVDSIDQAKVAHFQKLIDAGKYKVDAEAVADRLLDEHIKMDF